MYIYVMITDGRLDTQPLHKHAYVHTRAQIHVRTNTHVSLNNCGYWLPVSITKKYTRTYKHTTTHNIHM